MKKEIIGTVDLTPRWEALLPTMLDLIEDKINPAFVNKTREGLRAEFLKMAQAADKWNAHVKEQREAKDTIGDRNYSLIANGVRITGNYLEAYDYCQEQLYADEAERIHSFLKWVNQDVIHRAFGHGNYEHRFSEFLEANPEYKINK